MEDLILYAGWDGYTKEDENLPILILIQVILNPNRTVKIYDILSLQ